MADITINESDDTPELPVGLITMQLPPDKVEEQTMGSVVGTLLPMLGSMGVMVFMALSSANTSSLMMGGGMALAMVSMAVYNIYRQIVAHRHQVDLTRREYLAYLGQMRSTVREISRQQRRFMEWNHPEPDALVYLAEEGSRVWEVGATDKTALEVRVGTSVQDLSMRIELPDLPPLANPDAVCLSAVSQFVKVQSEVDKLPYVLDLGEFSHLQLVGEDTAVRDELRSIISQITTLISPTAVKIAVLCSENRRPEWEWLKWLPHAWSSQAWDAIGPERMVRSWYEDLASLLDPEVLHRDAFRPRTESSPQPHWILIFDDPPALPPDSVFAAPEGLEGVTIVSMPGQWQTIGNDTTVRLLVYRPYDAKTAPVMDVTTTDGLLTTAQADAMGIVAAEAVARRVTRFRDLALTSSGEGAGPQVDLSYSKDLMELLRIGDIRDFMPDRQWRYRTGRERLRVPFGVTPTGAPVVIDIKESAEQGMGPHGLLIGATGSGKSEVLRTMVLALALTHSPEQLNLVLVDFKGGATFAGMADLPHVSAMISNLESEGSLVDRMEEALRGEMNRRQEVLRAAGNYANVNDYEAARRQGKHQYPPLPALFLILDEFSELLSQNPDFIETFVAIGRLGRSLAIHLLLSSQRLEESKLRGLDSHLSYRIGLRTFSASESKTVLGVGDAYDLPPIPGVGYLKTGSAERMTRFRASYVAAPPPSRAKQQALSRDASRAAMSHVFAFTTAHQDAPPTQSEEPEIELITVDAKDDVWEGMSEIDIAVKVMAGHGQAHQIWLPPLDVPDTFAGLMPDLGVVEGLGLISVGWRRQGWLHIPLGTIDRPLEQRRDPLIFDLSGAAGHVAVVGGPMTGKSTFLRSVVMGLSLTHTPQEVQFYILDFGGGTFTPFAKALHVAGVATRDDSETMNRMLAEIEGILSDRENFFRANGIDSIVTYRQGRAEGKYDDGYGDVFLVIDGWGILKNDFPDVDTRVTAIAPRALTFGVHFVVSAARWADIRQPIRDIIGTRFELRLGETSDSEIDRKLASRVPMSRPGRGIEMGKHHALIALPRIDADCDPGTLGVGVTESLEKISAAWQGPLGPKLRLLPEKIELDTLRTMAKDPPQIILGIEESRLGPLLFNPAQESFLFLFGDTDTGKSTFLRTLSREIMRTCTTKQAQIYLVDIKRSLLGEIPEEYLAGYLTTREAVAESFTGLASFLPSRLPGPDVTPVQLRDRSWWTGAEAWILVDDYDLVSTSSGNPLAPLQPLMAQARDVGLHIVVTRRTGGASRAMYDPIIQTMSELGATGILLPGDPDEGQLIGRYKPRKGVPGRAQFISRDTGHTTAQLAWTDPTL